MISRSFVQASTHPRFFRKSAFPPLYCKQVAAFCSSSPYQRAQQPLDSRSQRCASISAGNVANKRHVDGFEYGQSGLPIELQHLISSRCSPRETNWGAVIDPYLPPSLRHSVQSTAVEQANSTFIQPINTLPRMLERVRQRSKVDLLSYLGVYQGRWEAVLWLVQAMMKDSKDHEEAENRCKDLSNVLWPSDGQSLDMMTEKAINVESPGVSRISLESVMNQKQDEFADAGMSSIHQSLGQIWQSLGTMILQAADRSPDDPTYSAIMNQVFHILGFLHRKGAFPQLIYNYTPPTDQTVIQRPPTLYLLSKRIMSTLSDVEFSLQWQQQMLKYKQEGYEVATTSTSVAPKIREFGPELWLDLVLWACVEGGWITEGAWIIGEMERRKASRETCWSTIGWQEICTRKAPEMDLASILRFQIDKTRLNQVGGIGIAAGGDSTVDMGTRTISREVVLAIMDGLLNIGHLHATSESTNLTAVQQSIVSCKNLLERGHSYEDVNLLNATILRIIENAGVDGSDVPGILQRVLDIRPATVTQVAPAIPFPSAQNYESDDVVPILGLLHRNLYGFASEGNIQGSLATFRKIQGVIDAKRERSLQTFAKELKMRSHEADLYDELTDARQSCQTATLSHQIPTHTLIAFLDLITVSRFYDLGKWLLQNNDIDGGIIDPELFSDPNLQPALLRFATATADDKLLSQILAKIEQPIPEPVLHALLHCQIVLGKWTAVEGLFEHFRTTPGMSWKATDAMAIAKAILLSQISPSNDDAKEQTLQAQDLLTNLLRGEYNSPQDPSQPPDFSQAKLANQLDRIFKSIPAIPNKPVVDTPSATNRAHASVSVPPIAFNILLEAVVESSGPAAGKALWERWCREPFEQHDKSDPRIKYVASQIYLPVSAPSEEEEKVVRPTPYMLRSILRPILRIRQRPQAAKRMTLQGDDKYRTPTAAAEAESTSDPVRRPLTQEEQGVLDWGADMFKKFGLSAKEINAEIPGAVPMPKPVRRSSGL